jgi:molybdopterin/thiamine biosynthesis adenylyltransferase
MNPATPRPTRSITQIGCGNIGSHLLPLLARTPGLSRYTIVDHDSFELRNLPTQQIERIDIGRPKAEVLAARARAFNAELDVRPIVSRAEIAPPGLLRADLIVACVDSRRARQAINQIAFRLGVPWLDTAVGNDERLVRIALFLPGAKSPCFVCGFDDRDYADMETVYECRAGEAGESRSVASLGALAAAVAAIEAGKFLLNNDTSLAGHELLIDAASYQATISRLPRWPACRFDHETLLTQPFDRDPETVELRELTALAANGGPSHLRVEGRSFARKLTCECGASRETLHLTSRWLPNDIACPQCRRPMREFGFSTEGRLALTGLPAAILNSPLSRLGIRRGDILHLEADHTTTCIEITTGNSHE